MKHLILSILAAAFVPLNAAPVVYQGTEGPGAGKHIVFLASDHEYRSEESCPALARILAKHHGFKCTVVFGVDSKGHIEAGSSNLEGIEALGDADLMVIFTRFLNPSPEQMAHFEAYLNRGGPIVGMRTASHAFKIPANAKYAKYDFRSKVKRYENGFGHQILGNTWVGHYGQNHKQGTRTLLVPEQTNHPILRGVADGAFCHAGAYNGEPRDGFTVLTKSQPLVSMDPKAEPDTKKPPVASSWTRYYSTADGKQHRVFHTTQGASEDILDPNYRRLVINGIFWAAGLEDAIRKDLPIDLVGPYQPTTFKMKGHVKGVKPKQLEGWDSPIMPKPAVPKEDAKNKKLDRAAPDKDPELAQYAITLKGSPRPGKAQPIATTLPIDPAKGTRIALIGNLLLDAERRNGHLETLLHQAFPDRELRIRNLSWPADEVDLQPRPDNFGDLDQHLLYFKTDLIIAAFGSNESFAGAEGVDEFGKRLDTFLSRLKSQAYNGESAPRIVLLSPAANEDVTEVQAATRNAANLKLYADALRAAADRHKVGYVDVLTATSSAFGDPASRMTIDGNALNAGGHEIFAKTTFEGLTGKKAPAVDEDLRASVVDKASQFFRRYRPLNTFYYTGGRSGTYGYLDFLPAMRNYDLMTANRDRAIWKTAAGTPTKPDDSKVPALDDVLLARGANEWLSPAEERQEFMTDLGFEVNCFASEEDFPELACPIAMRWDAKGRLWVSCSVVYPHLYPGQEPRDKIVILEDTDADGKADRCSTFADDLHIPLSFVLDGNGGVYVSEQPHLTHLRDTDGDGKADEREIVATGFGCEDSHHSLHDFIWTPSGRLLFRESIFHNTQVETPYGPVRAKNSAWFEFEPATRRITTFGSYRNTNPWGVAFDDWGHHVASHPVFADSFHATNPPYPAQHIPAQGMQAYSGVCGHDFVDYLFWPESMRGGFIKVRYKPTNRVEIHRWIEKEDHFAEEYVSDLIFSKNLSFIPVDFQFGPRGAAYVCDWYNPVKGHAQYSLRDPRRDRKSGRIWRIVPKDVELAEPREIDGASVAELLDLLKIPYKNVRQWSRRELRSRDHEEVLAALKGWLAGLETGNIHARLEGLWVAEGIGAPDKALLESLLTSDNHLAAAAAMKTLRAWHEDVGSEETRRLLAAGALHPSQHVRRETVLTASHVGGRDALTAVLPVLDQPAGTHLSYAIRTAFASAALVNDWKGTEMEATVTAKLKRLGKGGSGSAVELTAEEKAFDAQPGVQSVVIGCVPERLLFTLKSFSVRAGKPVKLTLRNPDATQHNLVIADLGTPVQEIGEAGNEMAKRPDGAAKHFIPDDPRILHATKLLEPESSETLRFTAPKKPGRYPFVCTFPGHWILMQGEMIVE
ncbi:hypothetical protein HAHE_21320 [Haloferula helveola]|uniref:Membrane-bound dehydrogenase domain-containing protein n=1 Tax=Haloferula helveola TaxID=490095 RepID=A0ABM7RG73_9BACT|nr:hypothetical protein HAHE_21320 [Haloferula helveola]